jgi:hypothetical protein
LPQAVTTHVHNNSSPVSLTRYGCKANLPHLRAPKTLTRTLHTRADATRRPWWASRLHNHPPRRSRSCNSHHRDKAAWHQDRQAMVESADVRSTLWSFTLTSVRSAAQTARREIPSARREEDPYDRNDAESGATALGGYGPLAAALQPAYSQEGPPGPDVRSTQVVVHPHRTPSTGAASPCAVDGHRRPTSIEVTPSPTSCTQPAFS